MPRCREGIVVAIALMTLGPAVAQTAGGRPETLPIVAGEIRIEVPIHKGHCRLDRTHAVDRRMLDRLSGGLDKRFSLGLVTMACDVLNQMRKNINVRGFEVFTYLTSTIPDGLSGEGKPGFAKQVCDTMATGATGVTLDGPSPKDKAKQLQAIAAKRKSSAIGVLQSTERACYVGQAHAAKGTTSAIHQVQAVSLVKGKVLLIGALSMAGTEIELLLPRAGQLITEAARQNGEE